ncbi:hypothetical protein FA95DRAFT_85004 [Auriscalpium vulgare]|uniref:Uncharacterized protein n=1 Tax=Auriscalpium vulgare TaxID=40419 RepID=A0ACB8RNQ4_9AGAM|nr:hypothetical protein FA95DRAFT_85004 [Auriscalpium vulgare]
MVGGPEICHVQTALTRPRTWRSARPPSSSPVFVYVYCIRSISLISTVSLPRTVGNGLYLHSSRQATARLDQAVALGHLRQHEALDARHRPLLPCQAVLTRAFNIHAARRSLSQLCLCVTHRECPGALVGVGLPPRGPGQQRRENTNTRRSRRASVAACRRACGARRTIPSRRRLNDLIPRHCVSCRRVSLWKQR